MGTHKENVNIMSDIFARIAAVQQTVGAAKRSTEGYGYKYATLNSIWELVRQAMADNGLGWTAVGASELAGAETGMPAVYNTLTVAVYETDHDGVTLMDMVGKGEALASSYMYPATAAQQVGSFETYYRRYGLIHLLGLTTVADDDGESSSPLPAPHLTEEFE